MPPARRIPRFVDDDEMGEYFDIDHDNSDDEDEDGDSHVQNAPAGESDRVLDEYIDMSSQESVSNLALRTVTPISNGSPETCTELTAHLGLAHRLFATAATEDRGSAAPFGQYQAETG